MTFNAEEAKRLAAELAKADELATPGPWRVALDSTAVSSEAGEGASVVDPMGQLQDHNAAFIAAARSLVPALIAECERLGKEVLVLRRLVKRIDETLRVPAAEYVPAISDVFSLIDALAADTGKDSDADY